LKIIKVSYTRKFNLGGYETEDVTAEAEVAENENFLETWTILRDNAEMWHLDNERKRERKPQPKPTEEPEPKGVVVNLNDLTWEAMPPTEKGPWEKALTSDAMPYPFIKDTIDAKDGRPVFMEGYLVWLNRDGSLGRRKK